MPGLGSSVSLLATLPSTLGYALDTIIVNGSKVEFSQDQKFMLQSTSSTDYSTVLHDYVTTYSLALTNASTSSSVTLASGSSSGYAYTSLSNFTVADETFYIASYLKGGSQIAYRVLNGSGATVIAETIIDTGSRIDSLYYNGQGGLILAYNNNTEFATLAFFDPDTPVATYDTATMKQDAVLKVDVLANDTDPNGDTLSIASATVVSGSADVTVVKGKISVDYTGAELWLDETAEITVHYVVTDGKHSSTGILTVDVTDGYNRMTADGSKGNFTGSTGRDYMLGGAGRDSFYGDAGSDIIVDGADLHGKQSNDFLYGGDGDDILIAGGGDNRLVGGGGDDILVGGAGADTLVGEEGNDILIDGAGNDAIIGGKGRDISYDGAGNDQYVSDGVDGADTFYFFLGGGKNKIAVFDSKDLLRIDADAAVGMQITRESNDPYYLVKFELADGGQILVIFEDKAAAKGSDWYEIGDYSVPTDPHGLY